MVAFWIYKELEVFVEVARGFADGAEVIFGFGGVRHGDGWRGGMVRWVVVGEEDKGQGDVGRFKKAE